MSINQKWDSRAIGNYRCLRKLKNQLPKESKQFLTAHPEIRAIIRTLLHEAINCGSADIRNIASSAFDCNKCPILLMKIEEHMKMVNSLRRKGEWDQFDFESYVCKSPSTHSLLSNTSLSTDIESILKFCLLLPKKC